MTLYVIVMSTSVYRCQRNHFNTLAFTGVFGGPVSHGFARSGAMLDAQVYRVSPSLAHPRLRQDEWIRATPATSTFSPYSRVR